MSKKITNYLINDSTNSYVQIGIGEFSIDNKSTVNRVLNNFTYEGELSGTACFIYDNLASPKCLRKDVDNILPENNKVVFSMYAPVGVSSDGRVNSKPHSLLFSFDVEALDFNPGNLINNANLGRIFNVLRDLDLSDEEKTNRINKINLVDDNMSTSLKMGDIYLGGNLERDYLPGSTSLKRKVVLQVVDYLITTNFEKPIAIVADKNILASIIKAVLLSFPCKVAENISFITLASTEEEVKNHLLSGVDINDTGISSGVEVINSNSVKGRYESLYVKHIDEISDSKEDDDLFAQLLTKQDYQKYLEYYYIVNSSYKERGEYVGETLNVMFEHFSFEEVSKSQIVKDKIEDLGYFINNFSSYKIDVEKFIDYLLYLKNSAFDESYLVILNKIDLELLLNEDVDEDTKQELCEIFIKVTEGNLSNLNKSIFTSFINSIDNLVNLPPYLTNYSLTIFNHYLSIGEINEEIARYIFECYGEDLSLSFIRKVMTGSNKEDKYTLLKYFIIYFPIVITDINDDHSTDEKEIAKSFKDLVMDENNFDYNLKIVRFFKKEYEKSIDASRYMWIMKYTMRSFSNLEEVLKANRELLSGESVQDVNQLHYQTSKYLFTHQKDINYDTIEEIVEIYEYYKNNDILDSTQQIEVHESELIELINEVREEFKSRGQSTRVFSEKGEFYTRRMEFEKLTGKMLDAAAQSKRIFTMHTSSFVCLGILAVLSLLLLIPIYILNRDVFIFSIIFPALSLLYSSIIQFAFNKAGLRTLILNMLRANLYGIYIPEIIIIIVLVIFLFV